MPEWSAPSMVAVLAIGEAEQRRANGVVEFRPLCAKHGKSRSPALHLHATDASATSKKLMGCAAAAPPTFLSLPDDVHLIAFSFLEPRGLANVGRTCKSLRNLPHLDRLWKVLLFRDFALLRVSRANSNALHKGAGSRITIDRGPAESGTEMNARAAYIEQLKQVRARTEVRVAKRAQRAARMALEQRQAKVQRVVRIAGMRVPCALVALCIILSTSLLHKYLDGDAQIGAWAVACPLLLCQAYVAVVWVASLLLLRRMRDSGSILGSVWARHNGLVKEWATLLGVKPLVGWVAGFALLMCALAFAALAAFHIASADELTIRTGQPYQGSWVVPLAPVWLAELVVLALIVYKARTVATWRRRMMPATALLALVCAFSVLLLLFLDKTLNISLALAFLPLWLLHVWVLIEPICAALLRWKAGYQVRIICASDSDTEMSVVALVLGRAIALAPSLAFLIMLCVQDVAPAGVTVYSPGQLLAPVYLWGAAVALSLLGQSFEYSEDVSTFRANPQVRGRNHQGFGGGQQRLLARRAASTPNLMIRSSPAVALGRRSSTSTRLTRTSRRASHSGAAAAAAATASSATSPSAAAVLLGRDPVAREHSHALATATANSANGAASASSWSSSSPLSSSRALDSPQSASISRGWRTLSPELDTNQLHMHMMHEESRMFRRVFFGGEGVDDDDDHHHNNNNNGNDVQDHDEEDLALLMEATAASHSHSNSSSSSSSSTRSWLSLLSDGFPMALLPNEAEDMELAQALRMSELLHSVTSDTAAPAAPAASRSPNSQSAAAAAAPFNTNDALDNV